MKRIYLRLILYFSLLLTLTCSWGTKDVKKSAGSNCFFFFRTFMLKPRQLHLYRTNEITWSILPWWADILQNSNMPPLQMFMHNRRAPVIRKVSFTKLAGNLFPQWVEGEMFPDPWHFHYVADLSTPTIHCNVCANLTEIGRGQDAPEGEKDTWWLTSINN